MEGGRETEGREAEVGRRRRLDWVRDLLAQRDNEVRGLRSEIGNGEIGNGAINKKFLGRL